MVLFVWLSVCVCACVIIKMDKSCWSLTHTLGSCLLLLCGCALSSNISNLPLYLSIYIEPLPLFIFSWCRRQPGETHHPWAAAIGSQKPLPLHSPIIMVPVMQAKTSFCFLRIINLPFSTSQSLDVERQMSILRFLRVLPHLCDFASSQASSLSSSLSYKNRALLSSPSPSPSSSGHPAPMHTQRSRSCFLPLYIFIYCIGRCILQSTYHQYDFSSSSS